jgi:hypothetical protein
MSNEWGLALIEIMSFELNVETYRGEIVIMDLRG